MAAERVCFSGLKRKVPTNLTPPRLCGFRNVWLLRIRPMLIHDYKSSWVILLLPANKAVHLDLV
jgi:hypothetical protein